MTLAQMSLAGAAVTAVVALIRPFAVDALPKRVLPLLWGLALARLLIPVPAPGSLSIAQRMAWVERVPSAFQAAREVLADGGTEKTEEDTERNAVDYPTENTGDGKHPDTMPEAEGTENPALSDTVPETAEHTEKAVDTGTPAASPPRFPVPLYTLWGAGTGTLFLLFAFVWFRFHQRFQRSWPPEDPSVQDWLARWTCRHKLRRPVSVRVCGEISGPLTFGLLRPVILLPSSTDWTDRSALEFVLYHELVHIRRFDAAYKLILTAALCLHWCNPLVWLLYSLAGRDLELACDEAVIRRFGREARLPYVNTLLDMESRKSGLAVPQFSARAAQERVAAVMKTRPPTLPARLISCVLALAVGLLAVSASPPASAGLREITTDGVENPASFGWQGTEPSLPEELAVPEGAAVPEEPAPVRTIKVWPFHAESYEAARENALYQADRVAEELPVPGGVLLCVEQSIMRDFRGHGVHQSLKLLSTDGTVTHLPTMLDADMAGRYENILLVNIRYNSQSRTVTWQVRTTAYPDGETDTCSYVWELGGTAVSVYGALETWEGRAVEIRSDFESAQYTENSFR